MAEIRQGGTTRRLTYDIAGQITHAELEGGVEVRYMYDPFGRRTGKQVGDDLTEFLWDGCVPAAEFRNRARGIEITVRKRFPTAAALGSPRQVLWLKIYRPFATAMTE